MKLLFDENTSPQLVQLLADIFPESVHVRDVGLQSATDETIWQFAITQGLMIVSKDSDMHQRSFLFGHPPKIIWIRLCNCSTSEIEILLRTNLGSIRSFCDDEETSFLSLS